MNLNPFTPNARALRLRIFIAMILPWFYVAIRFQILSGSLGFFAASEKASTVLVMVMAGALFILVLWLLPDRQRYADECREKSKGKWIPSHDNELAREYFPQNIRAGKPLLVGLGVCALLQIINAVARLLH